MHFEMERLKMTAVLRINEELNGIELYFDSKPEQEVLTHLKSNGFRYSGFKKCWWSKWTEKSMQVANGVTKQEVSSSKTITKTKKKAKGVKMGLWDATQWNEVEVNKEQEVKEMANSNGDNCLKDCCNNHKSQSNKLTLFHMDLI